MRKKEHRGFSGIFCMAEGAAAAEPVAVGDLAGEPTDPEPAAAAITGDTELPLDLFPESIRESLKGKTLKQFAEDHGKMRQIASKLGARNKELEEAAGKKPEEAPGLTDEEIDELIKDRQATQLVQQPEYKEVLQTYFETDEVSEDFLDFVEEHGVKVGKRDALKFLAFVKADRQNKIDSIGAATDGAVDGEELWVWMESEECPLSREILAGFNELADEADYSWVGTLVKKYNEFLEGGGSKVKGSKAGRFTGPTRRGRAAAPKAGEGDISKVEFQDQVMAVRRKQAAGQMTKAEAIRQERELTKRRQQTLGEK